MNLHVSRRTALKAFGAASLATSFVDRPEGAAARAVALPEPQADPRHKIMTRPLDGIIIGGGNRGWLCAQHARTSPDAMRIVGVAEPIPIRREKFQAALDIDPSRVFATWEDVFDRPRFADFVIVTTMDALHYAPAMRAMEMGYHVLLEKAIAQSWLQCQDILAQSGKYGRIVGICHVLRYAPYFIKMRDVVRGGDIGDVLSVQHLEPIGNVHQSHAFVRGNWRNEKESTPILLSKSCHDLDLFHWMLGTPCRKVSSFGRLSGFRREHAPAGSPARCTDGCPVEQECPGRPIAAQFDGRGLDGKPPHRLRSRSEPEERRAGRHPVALNPRKETATNGRQRTAAVRRRFRDRATLIGNIDPGGVLAGGTPGEV